MRALVIDDSKAMRIILKQILESIGAQVEEAGNGKEGIDKLKSMGQSWSWSRGIWGHSGSILATVRAVVDYPYSSGHDHDWPWFL